MEIWTTWHAEAIAKGVNAELAQLGYEVLRDHHQHGHAYVSEDGTWYLGNYPELMLQASLRCPSKAFLEFNTTLALSGPPELDAAEVAMDLLVAKLGSRDLADDELWREEPIWQALTKFALQTA
jgi:hypothetical protein